MIDYQVAPRTVILFFPWFSQISWMTCSQICTILLLHCFRCLLLVTTYTCCQLASFLRLILVSQSTDNYIFQRLLVNFSFLILSAFSLYYSRNSGCQSICLIYFDFCLIISRVQLSYLAFFTNLFSKQREFTFYNSSKMLLLPEISSENLQFPFLRMQTMHQSKTKVFWMEGQVYENFSSLEVRMFAISVVWLLLLVIQASSERRCQLLIITEWARIQSIMPLGESDILLLLENKEREKSLSSCTFFRIFIENVNYLIKLRFKQFTYKTYALNLFGLIQLQK